MWLDGAGLEILEREECLRLLASGGTGRIGLTVRALPAILPVRFVLDGERIVVRTGAASTLAAATRSAVVAFETDGRDDEPPREWSVVATGVVVGNGVAAAGAIAANGFAAAGVVVAMAFAGADDATESNQFPAAVVVAV